MEKVAIVVLSDPKSGGEEALGRVFNALATAYDCKQRNVAVTLLFLGTGTRWAAELVNREHPAHQLFTTVKDTVAGVSCGCADVFGARDGAATCGLDLLSENKVPGTSGLPSLARLAGEGYTVLTF
ncbi:DsrE family protein [Nitrospira sp. NS4]|uniref:DsrE family protein n=1 Tax=Nitrospira sp. NS4 TaxID=3414498 RepID=UPI003C2F85AD